MIIDLIKSVSPYFLQHKPSINLSPIVIRLFILVSQKFGNFFWLPYFANNSKYVLFFQDYPFNLYLPDNTIMFDDGSLVLSPILLEDQHHEGFVRESLDLTWRYNLILLSIFLYLKKNLNRGKSFADVYYFLPNVLQSYYILRP